MPMTDETTRPLDSANDRTDLADLVKTRMTETGISFRSLAAACVDPKDPSAGPLWTRSTLQNFVAGERVKPPRVPELRALAAGLGVPFRLVQDAAAGQFFGMDTVYSEDQEARLMMRQFESLSPEGKRKARAILETFWRD